MAFCYLSCPSVQQLVRTIQKDYNLVDDLIGRYLGVPVQSLGVEGSPAILAVVPVTPLVPLVPKKTKVAINPCCGKTAKGDPCRFKVKSDDLCGIHLRQRDSPGVKKAPKVPVDGAVPKVPKVPKKVRKEVPKHTHAPGTIAVECGLCETQGNVVVPLLTEAEFEVVSEEGLSIQDRLRAILAGADEDEEDEEEAPKAPEPVSKPVKIQKIKKDPVSKPVEVQEIKKEPVSKPAEIQEIKKEPELVSEEEEKSPLDSLVALMAALPVSEEEEEEEESPLDSMAALMATLPVSEEEEEEEEEDDEEEEEEEEEEVSMTVKLARLIAEEDSDSEIEEDDLIEQMSESPTSQAKLMALITELED
jgi:hypothetical protein